MSLKTLLMPFITQRMLSRERLQQQRERTERARVRRGESHRVHYFHQADDPYSALAAASLMPLLARYTIELVPHLVGPVPDAAAPAREALVAYSRRDAQRLAQQVGLPFHDPGVQPPLPALAMAQRLLVGAIEGGCFAQVAAEVSKRLWHDPATLVDMVLSGGATPASEAQTAAHMAAADAQRQQLGHYLGATFFYGGEWYWGLDRLHHLERRLQTLGVQKGSHTEPLYPPVPDSLAPLHLAPPPVIDFFFSLRSPYSAIVAPRVFALARRAGAQVRLRFVLPMVMRGLAVPSEKRRYIVHDAAREAFERGIPFGRINDPLGRPTERGLALLPYAEREGKGPSFLLSFMQGVWAEGINAGSDRGLRQIVERVGLSWPAAQQALQDESWRQTAAQNRDELTRLGLWGVPSLRVFDTAVWGQDRLWVIEAALQRAAVQQPN